MQSRGLNWLQLEILVGSAAVQSDSSEDSETENDNGDDGCKVSSVVYLEKILSW